MGGMVGLKCCPRFVSSVSGKSGESMQKSVIVPVAMLDESTQRPTPTLMLNPDAVYIQCMNRLRSNEQSTDSVSLHHILLT